MARVQFTDEALESLRRQDVYLRERNPSAAETLRTEVKRVVALLEEHPRAGPAVAGRPYRYFLTRRYRYKIVYLVQDDDVEVIEVLHPRQFGPS